MKDLFWHVTIIEIKSTKEKVSNPSTQKIQEQHADTYLLKFRSNTYPKKSL